MSNKQVGCNDQQDPVVPQYYSIMLVGAYGQPGQGERRFRGNVRLNVSGNRYSFYLYY